MHFALSSPDIIAAIFANLDQSDLARALRVCRLWNEWSDALWKSLSSLSPLIRVAFPFVFTNDDEGYIQGVPIYQINQNKFVEIAKSLRQIDGFHNPSKSFFHDYNPDILRRLLDVCEVSSPLFPKLTFLRTQCRNDAELLGVLPLLSSSLRFFEVAVHHSAVDFMSELLDGIGEHATNLECLDISCQPRAAKPSNDDLPLQRELDSYVYIPHIGTTLFALSSTLRTLSIPGSCMSIDTFMALAQLPLLQSLTFSGPWFSEIHGDEWPEFGSTPPSFPALQKVSLSCPLSAATRLLSAMPDSAPISHVQVDSPNSDPEADLSELSMVLARFRVSLCSIVLKKPRGAEEEIVPRWTAAFGPLVECAVLEELALDMPIDFSAAEAQTVSSRFRELRSLRLPKSVLSSGAAAAFSNRKGLRELELPTSAHGEPHAVLDSFDPTPGPSAVASN